MLFHTWPFLVFLLVVLPVFFALRKTRLWLPWLTIASYFFYGWWNPYYLLLVIYSTLLDFCLVALMDQCGRDVSKPSPACAAEAASARRRPGLGGHPLPPRSAKALRGGESDGRGAGGEGISSKDVIARLTRLQFGNNTLKAAFLVATVATLGSLAVAFLGPPTLRPTMFGLAPILFLMALGALYSSRKTWLIISLVNNLALLLFFKYARFVAENLNALFSWIHLPLHLSDPSTLMPRELVVGYFTLGFEYLLPVGISFFTFQSLSYTIDFYNGNVERERNFLRFSTFVCFFPQLMAGPIERARHLLPQFRQFPPVRPQNFTDGASLFLVGLFKKLGLANYLSFYVERVYDNPGNFDAPALMLATFAFAWQIFFDFSGYTDMARGIAKIMGFNLILNFNNPYLATGLGDFWSRWHISLSTWFRDYVYIPLGGNKHGAFKTYRNLFIAFFISGIWHGAAWTFVIWGTLHAVGTMVTRALERSTFYRERVPKFIKQLGVFVFVCFAWIFFRANSLPDALLIVNRLFTGTWSNPQIPALMLLLIAVIWLYQFLYESRLRDFLQTTSARIGIAVAMVLYLCMCASGGGAFIYFQF